MSNVLVVKAHPLEAAQSYSQRGLNVFITAYQNAHPEDNLIFVDVFKDDIPAMDADIFSAWNALRTGTSLSALTDSQQQKVAAFDRYTDQFLAADKIIIANPLWNLNIPAKLQIWIDTCNVAGKTFKYTAEGPQGLVTSKKLLHIQASGGIYEQNDPASHYIHTIFGFVGIKDIVTISIEGHMYQPENALALEEAFHEKLKATAETF